MKAQLYLLASTAVEHKTWWNPYLKGALIALMAVGLFIGAVYLLLYTNVGSRLGFLLSVAATTGFVWLLSIAWITGQFPNGPLGPAPSWKVEEVVADVSESKHTAVHDIAESGEEAPAEDAGQIKADLDAEFAPAEEPDGEFDLFGNTDDYVILRTYTEGGGRKFPVWWSQKTLYGVAEFCPAEDSRPVFPNPPVTGKCDPGADHQFAVLVHDLGARRLPSFYIFGGSLVLFALSLVALRQYEREMNGGPEGDGGPEPEPGPEPSPNGEAEPAAETVDA